MKALKIIFGIICAAGILLIIGTIGQDDFNTMVLQQPHETNYLQLIIGFLMVLPMPIICIRGKRR